MLRRTLLALILTSPLTGCAAAVVGAVAVAEGGRISGVGEATFDAMMLVQRADGEELLTGDYEERMTGRGAYTLTGPTWGTCTGTERGGANTVSCTGGPQLSFRTPAEGPKMSAVHVANANLDGQPVRLAIAWGKAAREATLRAALAGQ